MKPMNNDYPYDDLVPLPQPLPMPRVADDIMPIDKGIERLVRILRYNGVETDQSCEGGDDHYSRLPVVRFNGSQGEGYRALAIALNCGYKVIELHRVWYIDEGEIQAPQWELILHTTQIEGDNGHD